MLSWGGSKKAFRGTSRVVRYLEGYSPERLPARPGRPAARSFPDLLVWQRAHPFVLAVYRFPESFPQRERYGLAHPRRRAAVSLPAHIAEGFGKRSRAEKARFLNMAEGSLEECRYYLILAQDLSYGDTESLSGTLEQTSRLLHAYARAVLASSL